MQDEGAGGGSETPIPQAILLAAIVDSSFDAIVSKTLDGIITSWNPAAERIFGYSAREAIGQSIAMLLPAERLPEEDAILARLRRGERIENLETVRVRKDGRHIEVAVTSSPVRDESGRIVGASKIVRDTTERNAAARALARSEERFRAVFDAAFELFWLLRADGCVLDVNPAAIALGGVQLQELTGMPLWKTPWFAGLPETQTRLEREIGRAAAGESSRFELVVRSAGGLATLDFALSPIRDENGRVVLIMPEGHDITERKRFAQALHASESRLAGIIDSAMDAIITVDDVGRIVVFNHAAASMFGWTAQQITGQPLDRLIPARVAPGHLAAMTQFGESGATRRSMGRSGEIAGVRADSTEFPVDASISHVEVDGHQLYTVIMRDLTTVRQEQTVRQGLEVQLREAQKMEAIGTLAGGIAHDFNNIMGSIIGNVGLAKADLKPDDTARLSIDQIDRAATRARSLVRQILVFSRRQPQQIHNQALRPLIEEVIDLLRSTLPSVVRLEARLAEQPVHALVDSTQLHQVLVNLCTNAWHAMRGSTGRIELGLEKIALDSGEAVRIGDLAGGDHAHIWVSDDG